MADRTTKVTLVAAVSGYVAGMNQAAGATKSLTGRLAQQKASFDLVGRSLIAIGAVAAAGVGLAVKSFADFDAKMAQVKTLSHATAAEMDDLADSALHMGQAIGFSATEVADAEIELVKAGVAVSDIMSGALQGSLMLAAAGQIAVGDATEIATIALTQFGLKGKDVPHVADLLAAGADKALGGVADLGEALKSGGLVASQFGVSLDETVGTLAAFANAGLLGETAGTGLRQMLLKLANPSADAAKTMKELGISTYDAAGNFVGIDGLAGQLKDKMGELAPATRNAALATIFGSRAIQAANVLYKEGAVGIDEWTSKVNDSGFAAHQAFGKMDNLKGDLNKLGAAFNTNLIETGSNANDVLRTMTQTLTNVTKGYGDLPGPVQASVLAVGALVAVVGLVGGAFFLAVPRVAAFRQALDSLEINMKKVSISAGTVAVAVTALVVILGAVAQRNAEASSRVDELTSSLDDNTGAITDNTRAAVKKQLQDRGAFDIAKKLGISLDLVTDAALGNKDALKQVGDAAEKAAGQQGGMHNPGVQLITLLQDQSSELSNAAKKHGELAESTKKNADSTITAADAYKKAADEAQGLEDQLTTLIDTINKANGVGQDAVTTNNDYQQALADAADQVSKAQQGLDGFGLGLDSATEAGRKNSDMLVTLAKKGQDAAKAQFDLDGNTSNYVDSLTASHKAVYDTAIALGATADQAQTLADKIADIPSEKEIKILADTKAAQDALNDFFTLNDGRVIRAHVEGSLKGGYARGGYTGDIPPTAVAGVVHGREFVVNDLGTSKPANRAAMEFMNSGGDIGNYTAASYSPAPYLSASQSAPAPIYVQNPFTGEYLLAQVDGRAQGVVTQTVNRARASQIGVR